jgi:Skp family chaperone for outer membrane proteins
MMSYRSRRSWEAAVSTNNKKTRRIQYMLRIFIPLFAVLLLASQAVAAPSVKIAFVDLQRAVTESSEGIEAKADLLKKTEQFNAELKVLVAEFEKLKAEAEKDAAGLTAEARTEREKLLQKKSRDFQNRQREAQEELKQLETDYLKRITARLGTVIAKIGEDGSFTSILDRNSGVFYFSKDADITAQVVKQANDEHARKTSR